MGGGVSSSTCLLNGVTVLSLFGHHSALQCSEFEYLQPRERPLQLTAASQHQGTSHTHIRSAWPPKACALWAPGINE